MKDQLSIDVVMKRLDGYLSSPELVTVLVSPGMCRAMSWTRRDRREMGLDLQGEWPGCVLAVVLARAEDNMHVLVLDDEGRRFAEFLVDRLQHEVDEGLWA